MEEGQEEVEGVGVVAEEVVVVVVVEALQRADLLIPSFNKRLSAVCGSALGLSHTSKWE